MQLESYVKRELQAVSPDQPKSQELKLQVYSRAFACFIRAFKTYQPLLSAIKKEYENSLVHQQEQIRELEPLRSHLRLLTEECDRKIQARWKEEQVEIVALKREKQQLQEEIETLREKEKAAQIVVDHLQSELSNVYLQYQDERDARKLLIWQLNDLTRSPGKKEEDPAVKDTEDCGDSVQLQLALKVCREDLSRAQEELTRMKAEYWDVVPRRDWDVLEQSHKHTQLQLKTLQSDFDQLKCEYETLLELQRRGTTQARTQVSTAVQTDESSSQGQSPSQSGHIEEPINSDVPESEALPSQESREALRTAESDEETDAHVISAQSEADSSSDTSASQRRRRSAGSTSSLKSDT
ncbi:translin-associated factor X-interacting protein 1 [Salarias fasciatus]|uniref:translin-associated factor X-interacting protein 1 n=1 Tax=Salarias fasciatus TaxID=181472 RepID=UPI001176C5D4|nr:translin-associated factor X-interacting protein 1 [Salarias fasciatus]